MTNRTFAQQMIAGIILLAISCSCSGNKQKSIELNSEADLSGLTLSTAVGNYYEHKFSKRSDVKVFAAATQADALQAIRQGLADVFVADDIEVPERTLKDLGLKVAFYGDDIFEVAYCVKKGNTELAGQFNTFLASIPVQDIIEHWTKDGPQVPDPNAGQIKNTQPLRCAVCASLDPVCYVGEGGEWMGLTPDLLTRFANYLGRPIEIMLQDLGGALTAVQAGQVDMVGGNIFITEERKTFVDFTDSYYLCHPVFVVADHGKRAHIGIGERFRMNLIKENRWKLITNGLLETIKITVLAILIGTVLGIGVCAALRSRRRWISSAAGLYGSFIQGTPTLVLLLIMFYVVFASSGLSTSSVAIITFAFSFASSAGNIFNSSISTVPVGQTEAGLSLGFTPFKTFTGIVLPQALRHGLPLYAGDCVKLLQSTSIVGYIAIQDLTRASDLIRSRTFDALIPLLIITIIYFVLAWLIRKLLNLLLIRK